MSRLRGIAGVWCFFLFTNFLAGQDYNQLKKQLNDYLTYNTKVRNNLGLQVDGSHENSDGVWLYYDYWSDAQRERLLTYFIAYTHNQSIPLTRKSHSIKDGNFLHYYDLDYATEIYFAHVAFALWQDANRRLQWQLSSWSDDELSYILSSKSYFYIKRDHGNYDVRHAVSKTDSILYDPRTAFRFMRYEPEQGRVLIGNTPLETLQNLSEWIQDYLWHSPSTSTHDHQRFLKNNPNLEDKLKRRYVRPYGNVYLANFGCVSTSNLFADLMRSVNIPIKKVTNLLVDPQSGYEVPHSGMIFNWQNPHGKSLYMLHSDYLYEYRGYHDPAPAPAGTRRGVALSQYVWLDPSEFGRRFSYDPRPHTFGKATHEQQEKGWEMSQWLMATPLAIQIARDYGSGERVIAYLQRERNLTYQEALQCWNATISSVRSYGDGDLNKGFQRLLDGPDSRHEKWCGRTGKCN